MNMFAKQSSKGYSAASKGIERKTLVYGENTLMSEFLLKKGSILPPHDHIHEQTGYLVKGRILLSVGNKDYEVFPGDSWCIPSNVEHGAVIIEDSIAVEVFSPLRDDYLPSE